MVQIKKASPHGLYAIQAQLVSSGGYSYGIAGPTLAAGNDSNPYNIDNPISFEMLAPDGTVIDFTGGDRWLGSYLYGITSIGSFNFTTADEDADFTALSTGTTVDQTTNDEWTIYGRDELFTSRPQLSLIVSYRLQSREVGTKGGLYWGHLIVPRCWLSPKGTSGAPSFQAKGEAQYQFVPTAADRMINGVAFGANQGFTGNEIAAYTMITDNPISMVSHVVTGTAMSATGAYTPVSEVVGTASSTKNWAAVNGTAQALTTVTASTKNFAIASGLTADDYVGVIYETAELA